MNLFDNLVTEALSNNKRLSSLRVVVEKELLHHDILRIMSENDLLKSLTFIGGTALRTCYGGLRLSEDLDFSSDKTFSRTMLSEMGKLIEKNLMEKYNLSVVVSEPTKDTTNVDTWKVKVVTRPEKKHLPQQRINIDICSVPSYEKQPMMLINNYGVNMGTNGLVIQVESQEEIFIDKLLAFALRPNRIKYRDIWDIVWLHQKGIQPNYALISCKLDDRDISRQSFKKDFNSRLDNLSNEAAHQTHFHKEMMRFLPAKQLQATIGKKEYWQFIEYLLHEKGKEIFKTI